MLFCLSFDKSNSCSRDWGHLQIHVCHLCLFSSHYTMSAPLPKAANFPSKAAVPPLLSSLPHSGSFRCILGESWRSLLSAESFGLKAAVSCPSFSYPAPPVMLQAPALSSWSTKLPWMCAAIYLQPVVLIIFFPCQWGRNSVPNSARNRKTVCEAKPQKPVTLKKNHFNIYLGSLKKQFGFTLFVINY